ncbi:hypothetical protein EIKCOROL_00454 [Eikenella corrodens ATCC 23834]|uniref:Uncharacterized protein n=1 Tax=Eikenella corrodens ATCC 23834 TaxID=546274 RepID=C0DSY1_EIKCO|nr:hypothetical protein EIKCOROL_00454 [Eikenella corrodens ATCC 23834]
MFYLPSFQVAFITLCSKSSITAPHKPTHTGCCIILRTQSNTTE